MYSKAPNPTKMEKYPRQRFVFLKQLVQSVLIAVLTIPFTFVLICFLIFIGLPLKIYSKMVEFLAFLLDPDIQKMATSLAATMGRDVDDVSTKPCTVQVVCLRFSGSVNFEEYSMEFQKAVVFKLDDNKAYPSLRFPELQQYLHVFMGYLFMKRDRKFDVNKHIIFYNEATRHKGVTREELTKIWEYHLTKPFAKKSSPWELVVIDNYIPDENELQSWGRQKSERFWVALFRVHHALGDGFSIQSVLSCIAENPYKLVLPFKLSARQRFLLNLRALTLGTYDLLVKIITSVEPYHTLHRPVRELAKDYFIAESKLYSTGQVKTLKNKLGVSFTAILVSLVSGGLRKYLIQYGRPIPKLITGVIPFATLEHSERFCNDFSLTSVNYPLHLNDPEERLKNIVQQFNALLSTSTIKMTGFVISMYSLFPIRVFRWLAQKQLFCSTYSTMPGPSEPIRSAGSDLLYVDYAYSTNVDSAGFGISTLTYNGNFRFVLFIDKNLIGSREAAEDVIKFISEEFEILEALDFKATSENKSAEDRKLSEWKESVKMD